MRVGLSVLLTSLMLSSFVLTFNASAQEMRRLGINTTLRTYEEELKYLNELRVGAIRVPLQWQFIKIRPGEYDWGNIDRFLKAAQTRQVDVLFCIRTRFQQTHAISRPKRGAIELNPPSMDMKEWVRFVGLLASRYQGQGINYELENEVNEAVSWGGTLEEYLELLKAGYDAIKKADPRAKVLPSAMGCGIARSVELGSGGQKAWKWHDRWLEPILSTKKFDAVSVHDYYFPSEIVANGLTFLSYLKHVRDVMKRTGSGNLPIWITETGFVSLTADVGGRTDKGSDEKQAQWLAEAYRQAFESGVERIYWTRLRDSKEPYVGSMGLVDAKGGRRPAWGALSQFGMGKELK